MLDIMGDPSRTDEAMIAEWRGTGRTNCLDALVTRHLRRVRAIVYQMVLNDSDADDLTQETFLRAFRGLTSFNGTASFSTWLYRIALNVAHTHLKRLGRRGSSVPLDDAEHPGESAPDRQVLSDELEGAVAAAVADLSPALRAAVVLVTLQGLNVKDAAEIEECTVSTMYWRLHEARRILNQRLQNYVTP